MRQCCILVSFEAIACQSYLTRSLKQVGMIYISRAAVWYNNICTYCIVFELCGTEKKKEINIIEIFMFSFLSLDKG